MKSEPQEHYGGGKRKSSQEESGRITSKRLRCSGDDDYGNFCQIEAELEKQQQQREEDEDCSSSYSQVSTLTVDLKVGGDKVVEESTESKMVRVHHSRHGEDTESDDVTTVTTVGMDLDMEEIGSRADVHVSSTEREDRHSYVLSSGRRTAPKEQAVVTIDDEFEQYFGQLMI